jgi:hypothetical protein
MYCLMTPGCLVKAELIEFQIQILNSRVYILILGMNLMTAHSPQRILNLFTLSSQLVTHLPLLA